MHRKPVATLVAALLVLGFAAFGVLSADAANQPSFTAVANPLDHVPAGGTLSATTCPSAHFCVGLGWAESDDLLVVTGDPSSWNTAHVNRIALHVHYFGSSIACTSSTWCVAVGGDGTGTLTVLAGNPSTWGAARVREIQLGPAFAGLSLNSIACTSSTWCVAVGDLYNNLPAVFAGDPATWGAAQLREVKLGIAFGGGATLRSVACSSSTDCVAVGWDRNRQPLVLAGDPATWDAAQAREVTLGSAFGVPGGYRLNQLLSVTCSSSTSCVAVGEDAHRKALALAGDPSTWGASQARQIGVGGSLDSVACRSATSCVAVGGADMYLRPAQPPLLLVGDPSTWGTAQARTVALGAAFGSVGTLYSVACGSLACAAVGQDGNGQPLWFAGDPSTWATAQARELTLRGVAFGTLPVSSALACVSATSCVDVARYFAIGGAGSYLLRGDPATWDQAHAKLLTLDGAVNAMTCTSATFCVAVLGGGASPGFTFSTFTLTGNPATWDAAQERTIAFGSAAFGALYSIACTSSTYCVAVGEAVFSRGSTQPVVIVGNPSTWTAANLRQVTLARGRHGSLASVACTSRTHCVAVGHDGCDCGEREDARDTREPLVVSGNPATWGGRVPQAKQIGLGEGTGALSSVACPSPTYCVSVGEAGPYWGGTPLVLTGDPLTRKSVSLFGLGVPGSTPWTVAGFDSTLPGLVSVSCESTVYCVAVGADQEGRPLYIAGSPAHWNGRLLKRPARRGPSFVQAELTSSSCTPTACFAGGHANGGDFLATLK